MTPIAALHHHAQLRPNGVAFISKGDIWTYGRLATDVERLARGLVGRGVQKGDRVALHMTNTPELILAYYACFRIGAIAAPLNIRFKAPELISLLRQLTPALYIGQADLYNNIGAIDSSFLAPDARFVIGDTVTDSLAQPWATLLGDAIGAPILPVSNFHAPALLLITSGTDGRPNLVTHTPETISAAANAFEYRALDGDQIAIGALPMGEASGLFSFLACIQFGAPVILFEQFDSNAILDAIEDFHCSWILLPPFMFAALVEHQRRHPRDVRSLRSCLACGAICPTELHDQFLAYFGLALHSFWDATEAPGSLTYGFGNGSASRLSPGMQARLVDETGTTVTRGKIGELLLRGPNITIGYWREPGVIDSAMKSDWFHTGDFMHQDEKGELRFVSSKEGPIIRGASKIFPVEVERALLSHPAVEDAGVVGVPDTVLGERMAGFVKLVSDLQGSMLDDILTAVALQLADYKVPDSLTMVDEIPRNPQGEIDRNLLLGMIFDQKAATTQLSGRDERIGTRNQRSVGLSRTEDSAVTSDFSIGSSRNLSSALHSG